MQRFDETFTDVAIDGVLFQGSYFHNGFYIESSQHPILMIYLVDNFASLCIFDSMRMKEIDEKWMKIVKRAVDKMLEEIDLVETLLREEEQINIRKSNEEQEIIEAHFENKYEHLLVADEN